MLVNQENGDVQVLMATEEKWDHQVKRVHPDTPACQAFQDQKENGDTLDQQVLLDR